MSYFNSDQRGEPHWTEGFIHKNKYDQVVAERDKIKAAVQVHHDQKGDDRCHLDDYKLYYEVLGEGTDPYMGALPPTDDMEESCRRYIRQRRCPAVTRLLPDDMTIAQLTEEVKRLRAKCGEDPPKEQILVTDPASQQ